MRMLALAATVGLALTAGGTAFAGPWTDPNGRVNFTAPNGWTVRPSSHPTATNVLTFDAMHDCYVVGVANSVTANSSPDAVIRTTREPLAATAWVTTANSVRDLFPGNSAEVISQSVDTSGFWPVQRAQLRSSSGEVSGAIQSRPGFDLMAFCAAIGGSSTAPFDALFASISHPNDATWQAAAAQQAADREARAAAAAAAQAAQAQQQQQQPAEETDRRQRPRHRQ